jgi:hypothetical protein
LVEVGVLARDAQLDRLIVVCRSDLWVPMDMSDFQEALDELRGRIFWDARGV